MSISTLARRIWLYGAIALYACSDDAANTGAQNTTGGSPSLAGAAGVAAASGTGTPIMPGSAGVTAAGTSAASMGAAGTAAPAAGGGGGSPGIAGIGATGASGTSAVGAPAAGSGAATAGNASMPAAGSGAATGPTFTRVWTEFLMLKGCSGEYCHGSGMGGLMLKNKRMAYDALVNVPAAGPACAGKGGVRVKPGMPDVSLLLDKISHTTPTCGEIMPVGVKLAPNCVSTMPTVCTTEAELNLVRDWILAGAKDD
jgi:hypothetical protein